MGILLFLLVLRPVAGQAVEIKSNDNASNTRTRLSFQGGVADPALVTFGWCRVKFNASSAAYFNLDGANSTTPSPGDVWFSSAVLYYYDSATRTIVNTDSPQTLTNKTISTSSVWNGTLIGVGYGGTGTSTTFPAGSVVFSGGSGVYTQDNANLFWDDSTKRLGIGTRNPSGRLHLAGAIAANAWGTAGIQFNGAAATYTDGSTAASGTATNAVFTSIHIPTLAASYTSVTTTNAATLYVAGAPTAGTNMTITNAYALWIDAGTSRFDGPVVGSLLGSAAAPSFTFNGDTDTGMFRPTTSDELAFSTGGSERIRIDASGFVGVGTNDPVSFVDISSANLDSTGAGAANQFLRLWRNSDTDSTGCGIAFTTSTIDTNIGAKIVHIRENIQSRGSLAFYTKSDSSVGDTTAERMRIQADGTVSIGATTDTSYLLDVAGSGRFTGVISGPAGSASTPSYSFYTDPDTGIFRSTANTIGFSTAGNTRLTLSTTRLTMNSGLIFNFYRDAMTVTGGGTITPASSMITLNASSAVTLSSTTAIANGQAGDLLILIGTSDTYTVTINNLGNVDLAGPSRVLGERDTLMLYFDDSHGMWVEISFADN